MKWETIKGIYRYVLIDGCKIKYHGEDRYTLIWFGDSGEKIYETDFHDGIMDGKDIHYDYTDGTKIVYCVKKGRLQYELL